MEDDRFEAISQSPGAPPVRGLERVLRALSVFTLLMTAPQVLAIWIDPSARGVSLVSWVSYLFSACVCLRPAKARQDHLPCLRRLDSARRRDRGRRHPSIGDNRLAINPQTVGKQRWVASPTGLR